MQQDKKFLKIYVSGTYGYTGYASWMHFDGLESCLVYNIKDADLLVLPGGGDVSPELYGEEPHRRTYGSPKRDISECIDAEIAIKNGIPIIGICRGAQLLCVLSGGKLVQDINHPGKHDMIWKDLNTKQFVSDRPMRINSIHHQLQYPYNLKDSDYEVYGFSQEISDEYEIGVGSNSIVNKSLILEKGEPEIVYYPKIKGLGIQFHPEMMAAGQVVNYLKDIVTQTILKECYTIHNHLVSPKE